MVAEHTKRAEQAERAERIRTTSTSLAERSTVTTFFYHYFDFVMNGDDDLHKRHYISSNDC
eukprot:456509-Amphidinium_carterae.1